MKPNWEKIEQIRASRGLSQQKLVNQLGITIQAYTSMRKKTPHGFLMISSIAKALDVKTDDIVIHD